MLKIERPVNKYLNTYIDKYEKEYAIDTLAIDRRVNRLHRLHKLLYQDLRDSKNEEDFKSRLIVTCKNIKYRYSRD